MYFLEKLYALSQNLASKIGIFTEKYIIGDKKYQKKTGWASNRSQTWGIKPIFFQDKP